ncbi:hypothetical protein F511_05401 [Dorcoceras hygrometricum]|uniref:Uncharacterized protein n=1 Tax=Dorcoceras hygrometricum TaxID=472368 RepID=A0A2Z7BMF8_9LAMI|nr:hypothetical protein F511_05401 [Dorcoceras hygrometricum]
MIQYKLNEVVKTVNQTQFSLQDDLVKEIRENKKQLSHDITTLSSQVAEVIGA